MGKLFLIFGVLRKGRRLANVEVWKTASALTAALAVVLPDALSLACNFGVCLDLTAGQINSTAASLGGIGSGLFILWSVYATSDKVGL